MMHELFARFRDRRVDEATRSKHRETVLTASDFIWPVFLIEGQGQKVAIPSMPGVCRVSIDIVLPELKDLVSKGLMSVLLFGIPHSKGIEQAWSNSSIIAQALPHIKAAFPTLIVITDVCLCSYSLDGHCHVGENDATCEVLAKIAVSHALAGADVVAPSDMMDGRVLYIKNALHASGYSHIPIMSYAAKFASAYYGPFRDAADCAPQTGDRKTYQMDPANGIEALAEIEADIAQGATSVIVKPALAYLDIISIASQRVRVPVIGYNVSGEYAMLTWAVSTGVLAESVIEETLLGIKRAGANKIVSYFTPWILHRLASVKI